MEAAFTIVDEQVWVHKTPYITPLEIIQQIKDTVSRTINEYEVLPACIPARDKPGYERVFVEFPVGETLFDQFFNGRSGYRAQYYVDVDIGSRLDLCLIQAIAPLICHADHLYKDKISRELCERSLTGRYSKFWFSTQITDPSAQAYLKTLPEVVLPERWVQQWKHKPKPRKGLLAPPSDAEGRHFILFNGTFINPETGEDWNPKHGRAEELHETGWT